MNGLPRKAIRIKLTVLYTLLFLAAGVTLLTLDYALLVKNLPINRVAIQQPSDPLVKAKQIINDPKAAQEDKNAAQKTLNDPEIAKNIADQETTIIINGKEKSAAALAALPTKVRSQALSQFIGRSAEALAFMVIVSSALGWWLAGRMLRPLDVAFLAQRRFVANASHELRTPLTIMRTELEVTMSHPEATVEELRSMGTTVQHAVERSGRLVESLLLLASGEQGLAEMMPVDVAEVASHAVEGLSSFAVERHVTLTTAFTTVFVQGDPVLLESLIQNLVENAIQHNHADGWARVSIEAVDAQCQVVVENSGELVPPERTEELFEPFRQLGTARVTRTGNGKARGAGLGLSIVRAVAMAHGGKVVAIPLEGGGLRVEVTLPPNTS